MVRKWGAMYYSRKLREFSLVALLIAVPSLAFADTVVTSQAYVDMQDATKVSIAQGTGTNNANVGKTLVVNSSGNLVLSDSALGTDLSGKEDVSNKLNGTSTSGQKIGDLTAGSAAGQDQVMYPSAAAVKEYSVAKHQGTQNQVLQVDSSGNLVPVTMDTTPTASSNKPVTSGGVKTYADSKVSSSATISDTATATAPNEKAVYDALDGKLDKNTAITGATKTKITYDSNGLVTAGADLVASDIPDLSATYEVKSNKVQTIDTTLQSGKDSNYPSQAAVESYVTAQASNVITQSITNSDTTHAPSGDAVYDALNDKQTKPSSGVANGKVLTYTGTDANASVSAAYVNIPVSSGAPSTNTPSSFAEVWIQ